MINIFLLETTTGSVMLGEVLKITEEELEEKKAKEKTKYILTNGYLNWNHITLIKAIYELAKDVDRLQDEIADLKQQLKQ